jgi:allantoinase
MNSLDPDKNNSALADSTSANPMRRLGMDHDRYRYSMLQRREPFLWPGDKKVAVWICVAAQFFPLNQTGKPFKVPGGMTTPYPDLRHASLRDYGNRVGIFRVLDALQAARLTASFAVNAELVARCPSLVKELASTGEIIAHGMHMDALHAGAIDPVVEFEMISRPRKILQDFSQQAVAGWLSPAKSQTSNTPDLLKSTGFRYACDWVNDELAYKQQTTYGDLIALPLSTELSDQFVLMNNQHSAQSWCQQVCDAFDCLVAEAEQSNSARLLSLHVHPWLIGQPHRIGYLEQALQYIASRHEVFSASPSAIIDAHHW